MEWNDFFDLLWKLKYLHPIITKRTGSTLTGSSFTQWEHIIITSMEVDFWELKSSGCEKLHATEVK
jgi:hypothetical protein